MNVPNPKITTGALPASRKIYVAGEIHKDIRVPMREISVHPTAGEPPLPVYDSSGPYTDPRHAIDIETGETVWTDVLPAGGQANPITYEAGGRQYVMIAPGGHHFMETGVSDAVIAYGLPE